MDITNSIMNKLHKYKRYKGNIFRVYMRSNDRYFSIKTNLNLKNKHVLSTYKQCLKDENIQLLNFYEEPIPTLITRIILFLEYLFLGWCLY